MDPIQNSLFFEETNLATDKSGPVNVSPFDHIRKVKEDGVEYWTARDLYEIFGYSRWEDVVNGISRARLAIDNALGVSAGQSNIEEHLTTVRVGFGYREVQDFHLTRYAAYIWAMNCDPTKPEIAAAQTYFAVRTREAETQPKVDITTITKSDLARMILESESRLEAATKQLTTMAPKAEQYLIASGGARLIREVAKTLGTKEGNLRRLLVEEGLIFPKYASCGSPQYDYYAAYSKHFQARETIVNHQWGTCSHYTLYVLPQGVELIQRRLRNELSPQGA